MAQVGPSFYFLFLFSLKKKPITEFFLATNKRQLLTPCIWQLLIDDTLLDISNQVSQLLSLDVIVTSCVKLSYVLHNLHFFLCCSLI